MALTCPQPKKDKSTPKSSAIKKPKHNHKNLTLSDWLAVVEYYDTHQPLSQPQLVKYFANKNDGALKFTQSALLRHLSESGRTADQAKLASNPTALSLKRVRVVTRPDVEKALVLWVQNIEEKGEQVNGPMLIAKREKFEKAMDVPEEQRMKSDGWVANFYKM
ncbi:hypothetical protein HWV62_40479 [Athelia sp. TMB]|nr:hypothetical protein HWV62_40479 [Athelia sp. TMB]